MCVFLVSYETGIMAPACVGVRACVCFWYLMKLALWHLHVLVCVVIFLIALVNIVMQTQSSKHISSTRVVLKDQYEAVAAVF